MTDTTRIERKKAEPIGGPFGLDGSPRPRPVLGQRSRNDFAGTELDAARRHMIAAMRHLRDGSPAHVAAGKAVTEIDTAMQELAGS